MCISGGSDGGGATTPSMQHAASKMAAANMLVGRWLIRYRLLSVVVE
jgi:hypothetical protein